MEKLLLNADEASYLLGISKSTLYRLTNASKLRKVNLSKRRVAWTTASILQFIKDCSYASESP